MTTVKHNLQTYFTEPKNQILKVDFCYPQPDDRISYFMQSIIIKYDST